MHFLKDSDGIFICSERMLELLNKDDISNDTMAPMQLNSKVSIPRESPLSETSVASFAKPCSPSPASPDFGFRLGPADPRVPQSYSFFPSLSMVGKRFFSPCKL